MMYKDDRMSKYFKARAIAELRNGHSRFVLAGLIGAVLISAAVVAICLVKI